jgi:hypothetical protein
MLSRESVWRSMESDLLGEDGETRMTLNVVKITLFVVLQVYVQYFLEVANFLRHKIQCIRTAEICKTYF